VIERARDYPPTGRSELPNTITAHVVEQLRDRIVLGTLKPGQKLQVYELTKELGVSRVPLREAIRQLEAEFLIDSYPRRGAVVRELKEQDLLDSFEILNTIEVIAVQRAAEHAIDETIAELQYWLEQMLRLARREVSQFSVDALHAHRQFHFAFFRAAGGGVLQQHLYMLWNTWERYVINTRDAERQVQSAQEHARLVERIEARDAVGTAEVLRAHLQAPLKSALRYLDSQQTPPATTKLRVGRAT
jgi:DNA-binding GntR family transcriptional regulator